MDLRALIEKMDEIESAVVEQTGAPTQFTPTHFHKNNLGGKISLMKTPDDKWWWISQTKDASGMPGPQGIVPWYGNTENRSAWNPASVDGEIKDGKYIDYPEGVTWKTATAATTPATTSATANVPGVQNDRAQAGPMTNTPPAQGGLAVNDADKNAVLLEKLKRLEELINKYNSLKNKAKKESTINIEHALLESFGYNLNESILVNDLVKNYGYTLSEASAAMAGTVPAAPSTGAWDSVKGFGGKILSKVMLPVAALIEAWGAWEEIQKLDKTLPEPRYTAEVSKIVSKTISSIGLFWAGAILGGAVAGAITGPGAIVGFIAGGIGGLAASYTLGDDLNSIVDAIVEKVYQSTRPAVSQNAGTEKTPAASSPTSTASTKSKPAGGNSDIMALQTELKTAGYDLGTFGPNSDGIDGKIGSKTITAIQQELNKAGANLAVDGKPSPELGKAINKLMLA
jgi:hypothetical protein